MPVISNAASSELSSPFLIENERICNEFDRFIVHLNGETRGKYNAFSYNVLGKVRHPNKWQFNIKKSSYSSGSIWLSSKYQSLHMAALWIAKEIVSNCPEFYIRPKKTFDFLLTGSSKKWNWFSTDKKYMIKSKDPNNALIVKLSRILKNLLDLDRIWEISYKNSELKIDLRSEDMHTKIIENLLQEKFDI